MTASSAPPSAIISSIPVSVMYGRCAVEVLGHQLQRPIEVLPCLLDPSRAHGQQGRGQPDSGPWNTGATCGQRRPQQFPGFLPAAEVDQFVGNHVRPGNSPAADTFDDRVVVRRASALGGLGSSRPSARRALNRQMAASARDVDIPAGRRQLLRQLRVGQRSQRRVSVPHGRAGAESLSERLRRA